MVPKSEAEKMERIRKAIYALLKREYTLEDIAEDLEGWV